MVKISGRLVEPADDKPRSGVTLILSSVKNSSVVLKHATYRCVTGGNGEYSFNAAPGTYAVAVSIYGAEPERVGLIRVYSDSLPGDLNSFLMAPTEDDLTPEIILLVDRMRSDAMKAAESAKQSEQVTSKLASDVAAHAEHVASDKVVVEQKTTIATDAAATAVAAKEQTSKDAVATGKDRLVTQTKAQEAVASANAAKAAQDSIVEDAADVRDKALQVAENTTLVANNAFAVQLNTEQVAQNTQTVTTKTQQVSENAQAVAANTLAVTQMRDEVVAKTSMAQAAADTATQKAASAAEHDAAAAEYARQAQEAAQATAGALIDGGAADLSTGVYPQPVQVSGTARPTFWKVTKGGTVGGVDYGVGDTLIYTVAGSGSYYKIDNTESVTSVQGEKGAVTLTPEKVGADPAGTSAANILQHESKSGAHQISAISGLADALAGKLSISSGPIAFRNLVNNGGMQISQRGSLFPNVGNGDYTLDRWRLAKNSGAMVSVQRRTDDRPSGIGVVASLELKVQTADTSISSSEYVCIQQPMEGVNILPIYGNTFVISFWVKSSLSGKYSVSLLTDSPAYSFVAEYTINAANTWERKSIVVTGGFPLSYELQLGNVTGMRLTFAVACGSSLQTTQGAWRSGGFFGVADQVNLLGKVDATFSLTAVQLELGGIPTPFEYKPFPLELSICQRYCLQVNSIDVASETIGIGGYCTGSSAISQYNTPVEMRDTPSWIGGTLSIVTTAGITPVSLINKRGSSIFLTAQNNTAPSGQSCYAISSGMNAGFRGFIAEL
ncbi:hypothetical protein GBN32_14000 [Plesiomonas shigelloides]|uniref:prophage tail fiber N-terminal domain-containing protein n=1 Tax=Plesiomonas shigelloides TaxID=703 RepID=UPI0012616915|nr:prophage tail fiber N-terminal domain-containing protein [Plesiomonas shigelloides]KAB7707730.1 hypothetical protein GBN32_14000 [Plesiomonas shigelloides]